ncbi:MAG TPA: YtxH domain-containing protein [Stenomitos sp.]
MAKRDSGVFLGGVLLGTAVGTVMGLLFAPRSGRDTRQILKKSAEALPELVEDLSSSLQLQADRLSVSALNQWDETLERLRSALQEGVEAASAQQRQTLQSFAVEEETQKTID